MFKVKLCIFHLKREKEIRPDIYEGDIEIVLPLCEQEKLCVLPGDLWPRLLESIQHTSKFKYKWWVHIAEAPSPLS